VGLAEAAPDPTRAAVVLTRDEADALRHLLLCCELVAGPERCRGPFVPLAARRGFSAVSSGPSGPVHKAVGPGPPVLPLRSPLGEGGGSPVGERCSLEIVVLIPHVAYRLVACPFGHVLVPGVHEHDGPVVIASLGELPGTLHVDCLGVFVNTGLEIGGLGDVHGFLSSGVAFLAGNILAKLSLNKAIGSRGTLSKPADSSR